MNLELIKQTISDAIPESVEISNIDIKKGIESLMINISWIQRGTYQAQSTYEVFHPITMDGYVVWAGAYQQVYNKAPDEKAEYIKAKADKLNQQDDVKPEDEHAIQVIRGVLLENPKAVEAYAQGKTGNLGFIVSKILVCKDLKGQNVRHLTDLIKQLLPEAEIERKRAVDEALIEAENAEAICIEQNKYNRTLEGKIISDINIGVALKCATETLEEIEAKAPWPNTEGSVKEAVKERQSVFRRNDGYTDIPALAGAQRLHTMQLLNTINPEDVYNIAKQHNIPNESVEIFKKRYGFKEKYKDQNKRTDLWDDDFELACRIYQAKFGGEVIISEIGRPYLLLNNELRVEDWEIMYYVLNLLSEVVNNIKAKISAKEAEKAVKDLPISDSVSVGWYIYDICLDKVVGGIKALRKFTRGLFNG